MINVVLLLLTVLIVESASMISATLSPNNGSFIIKPSEIIYDR